MNDASFPVVVMILALLVLAVGCSPSVKPSTDYWKHVSKEVGRR